MFFNKKVNKKTKKTQFKNKLITFVLISNNPLRHDQQKKKKEKTKKTGQNRFKNVRERIRTLDLLVRSQTLYPAELHVRNKYKTCRRPGSNRYGYYYPRDFKSRASANSATPAKIRKITRAAMHQNDLWYFAKQSTNHRRCHKRRR